jgi:hypothetical protein
VGVARLEELDDMLEQYATMFEGVSDTPSRVPAQLEEHRLDRLHEVAVEMLSELRQGHPAAARVDDGIPDTIDPLELPLDVLAGDLEVLRDGSRLIQ